MKLFCNPKHLSKIFFIKILALSLMVSCNEDQKIEGVFNLLSSKKTSVTFRNVLQENEYMNNLIYQYYYSGSGVSIGDINNDGLEDIYFTGNIVNNKLYLNKGDLKFKDITVEAGVKGRNDWCTGTTMADVNNDGYLDIYICYSGRRNKENRRNELFINQGDSTFKEHAKKYGLDHAGYSTQAIFFDYDKDGDLDMYLVNHNVNPPTDGASIDQLAETENEWVGDKLYENTNESGTVFFKDVSVSMGIYQKAIDFGLGASVGDLNNDGWPDIYVSNDLNGSDFLYINQGARDGKHKGFKDDLKNSISHTSLYSMGNDISDLNNDGWLDIMVLDMASSNNFETKTNMSGMDIEGFHRNVNKGLHYQYMYNTLQMNNGIAPNSNSLKFSEVAQFSNLSNTDWSWGPLIADYDNDGEKDIYITNGLKRNDRNNDYNKHIRETLKRTKDYSKTEKDKVIRDLVLNLPILKKNNFIFKGSKNLAFKDMTKEWGVELESFSNGASYADLDNDGDLEIVVNNIDDEAFIFKNYTQEEQTNNNAYLKVKLNGSEKNPFGIGSKVILQYSDKTLTQENYLSRGYLSSISPVLHFGLGNQIQVDGLTVIWSDGKQQRLNNLKANQTIVLNYNDSKTVLPLKKDKNSSIIFKDVTDSFELNYKHEENSFNDYDVQILLPHKYSQFGPSLSVADVNGDGLEDFYVGGAIGQAGELYIQTNNGGFKPIEGPWKSHAEREDISSIFFDANTDGIMDLLIISGGNEYKKGDSQLQDRLYLNTGLGKFKDATNRLPKHFFSGAIATPCDFDGDGDMDLFVGERHIPHNYPKLASGYLYENTNGFFKNVTDKIAPGLSKIGLITDATWADINGDGLKDLILVGEWMAIHVYYNEEGSFKKMERLPDTEGWWYSVEVADFDSDGDLDIVAGNLGLNYKYKASLETPFEVFASDFNEDNKFDIILGIHEGNSLFPLRGMQCSSDQLSYIKEKFPTYEAFGKATITDVIGKQKMEKALNLKSKTFATTYFENTGDGLFKTKQLPFLTQLSSVNTIEIKDFDTDGNLDAVIAGNLYTSEVETPRNDASQGVFLKGNGHGDFEAKYPYESGIFLNGDVKQCTSINIGGVLHLLVATNDGKLKLIRCMFDNTVNKFNRK